MRKLWHSRRGKVLSSCVSQNLVTRASCQGIGMFKYRHSDIVGLSVPSRSVYILGLMPLLCLFSTCLWQLQVLMRQQALGHPKNHTQGLFDYSNVPLKSCLGRILGRDPELEFGSSQPDSSVHSLPLVVTLWDTLRG